METATISAEPKIATKPAIEYLKEAFNSWTLLSKTEDDEIRKPTTLKQIRDSEALLAKAKANPPSSKDEIEYMDKVEDVLKYARERRFDGNIKLLIYAVVVVIIFTWMSKFGDETFWGVFFKKAWFIWGGIILYVFASFTPNFLIDKRSHWFRGITNRFTAGLFGALLANPTDEYKVKWSDGSTTHHTEFNPLYLIGLLLKFFWIFINGFFIFIWGIINLLRNWILYI